MAKIIVSNVNNDQSDLEFESVMKKSGAIKKMTFATATDGNHGRAVAWCAKDLVVEPSFYQKIPRDIE